MRLLNSVCKVIADNFPDIPVHIEQVPNDFTRPCFLVELVSDPLEIKNYHVYQKNPTFQIVYFGERDIAEQVISEPLYDVQETLTEIFLLALALPVIPARGVEEKQRFAKIESFTHSLRLDEGAVYCSLKLNFTESIKHEDDAEIMSNLDLRVKFET